MAIELGVGQYPDANLSGLYQELLNGLPPDSGFTGTSRSKTGDLTLYFEGVSQDYVNSFLPQIEAILAAHDPAVLTAEQLKAQKAQEALDELTVADYQAWQNGVTNISNLAEAKVRLSQLGRVVWLLLQAQGISEIP